MKGAYRPLVTHPRDLEWTWLEDEDKGACIYIDLLLKSGLSLTCTHSYALLLSALSLQLSFSLDSGSFATMCLREVLHSDL